jgi:coenzyme F420-reducing hydrogenase alpha subunit
MIKELFIMLIKRDYTGKTKSVYECDKCKRKINTTTEKRYRIKLNTYKNRTSVEAGIRTYDLCRRCASIINNYIMKGIKKKEE